MSEKSGYEKLREQRPGAIEAAATVVRSMLAQAPDGSPDWKTRKEAATALKGYLDDGTFEQLAEEVIAEAKTEGDG